MRHVIVAAAQPYFIPFPGYFAKALLSDVLVLYDTVQFPQRTTWVTRNRIKGPGGELWVTLPALRRGLGLQRIAEVRLRREGWWARKHLETFREHYAKAPFAQEHLAVLARLFAAVPDRLLDLTLPLLRHLAACLGAPARVVLLSELGVAGREPGLSVAVARHLGADAFLAPRPAGKFLDPARFAAAGVRFLTFAYHPQAYPQMYGNAVLNLSALDLLCCCGPKAPALLRSWVRAPEPAGGRQAGG